MTDIKKGFCKIRSVGCLHKRIEDFLRIYYKSIYHQLWIHYYIILWKLFSFGVVVYRQESISFIFFLFLVSYRMS